MHESEAMDFIVSVLRGFMERNYKLSLEENMEIYFSLNKKIQNYIHDHNGHWVQVKATDVINSFEDMETNIFLDASIKPATFNLCIDLVLHFAEEAMKDRIYVYKTKENEKPKWIHDFFPLPLLPDH